MARTRRDGGGGLSGWVVLRVGRLAEAHGVDAESLYAEHGLSIEALSAAGARVPYALVVAVGERAAQLTGLTHFGLHLGMTIGQPQGFDAGALMLMASSTCRSGLSRVARLQEYWSDGERLSFEPVSAGGRVRFVHTREEGASQRHLDECAMAEVVVGLRYLSGVEVRPRVVRFAHPRPADTREHEALFGCALEFDAPHTELEFDDAALDTPMRHASAIYCEIFEGEVRRALERRPGMERLAVHVHTLVRGALAGPEGALERTATLLRTSTRTLQRRLRDEGTSFAAIVEAVRRELAQVYLAQDLPLEQIASRLGYTQASAFHRAFKRWTGLSPEQSRRGDARNLAPSETEVARTVSADPAAL